MGIARFTCPNGLVWQVFWPVVWCFVLSPKVEVRFDNATKDSIPRQRPHHGMLQISVIPPAPLCVLCKKDMVALNSAPCSLEADIADVTSTRFPTRIPSVRYIVSPIKVGAPTVNISHTNSIYIIPQNAGATTAKKYRTNFKYVSKTCFDTLVIIPHEFQDFVHKSRVFSTPIISPQ